MAGMSLCDQMLTSDGGVLHISVGVGVPTVAMFGNSDADFWGQFIATTNKVIFYFTFHRVDKIIFKSQQDNTFNLIFTFL